MQLFAFGVNHNTAPLAVREQVTFHAANLEEALRDLVNREPVREAAQAPAARARSSNSGIASSLSPGITGAIEIPV